MVQIHPGARFNSHRMASKKLNFVVSPEKANTRLDVFLSEKMAISRSQAQKLIETNEVMVNDKEPKKSGDILKEGYKVVIQKSPTPPAPTKSERSPLGQMGTAKIPLLPRGGKGELPEPKIIAETKDYLVVEKPTGMLTHPTMANEKNALSSWLSKKYPGIKKVGDDPKLRPGIVHRLDKEASGLLVVARTQKMFDHLKKQFKERTIEKEYYALVHDPVQRNWDTLNFPIARAENADRMAARPLKQDDAVEEGEKEAKTEFLVEKNFVNFSLLRVILHTGRMHQIRVHFLAYNHPLVGDPLYIQKKRKRTWDEKLGRLFLHSTKLSFTDLEGNRQTFESPLPKELTEFLTQLA